ncbi:hypothetical protein CHH27_14385 [Labrenzia sp. VG12]|nr:hypothetical protein CHH27_14385 [Labrenzia sp. VG12]
MTLSRRFILFALVLSALIHAGAAALTLTKRPALEVEGGGPVSHAVLGQSPFNTVLAGTTAAVARAEPVPPNPIEQPSLPEKLQRALPPDADPQQPVQPTPSKPVVPASVPVTTPLPSSRQVAPLKATNVAGLAFPEKARPATQPASSVPTTSAKQPENLKEAQAALQPSEAVRVENRTTKAVAVSDQKAAPTTVQKVAAAVSPQQSARTETEAVPPPPVKPAPPRRTPVTKTRTASKKPEKEAQKAKANTRSGAGGKSAQTTQKGGSQKKGTRTSAGNSDVTNYPAKVHRKLLRAVRKPRSGRKARQDAVVRFTVARNGSVSAVRLARSSGSKPFDQAVLKAVRSAAPFPPIPAAAGKKSWTFTLPVGVP